MLHQNFKDFLASTRNTILCERLQGTVFFAGLSKEQYPETDISEVDIVRAPKKWSFRGYNPACVGSNPLPGAKQCELRLNPWRLFDAILEFVPAGYRSDTIDFEEHVYGTLATADFSSLLISKSAALLSWVSVMSREMSPTSEPKTIKKLATAVYPSFAMLAGMQLDVFTPLKNGPMSAEQIADAIGVKPSKLKPLLYALVAAELLTVEGNSFSNTDEANLFLVRDTPSYVGDHVHLNPFLNLWIWRATLKTAESIRTGIPQEEYDESEKSEEELESIFRGTRPIAVRAGRELVARYNFSSYRTLLDVGGGSGGLAVAIIEACPHIQATVVDLPRVTPVTRHLVNEAGAADRVNVMTADVVRGPLIGSFDVAVLRAFIQVLWPNDARNALKNVSAVINPGGAIYILGHILDNSRISPLEEVGHNLASVNAYERVPADYTEQEHKDWLTEAGFEQIERTTLPNGDGVMTAKKPM